MTQDNCPRVSSSQSVASTDSSSTKQRRKRKWDQPAESLIAAGIVLPGVLPLGNVGSLAGMTLQGVTPAVNHTPISTAILQQVMIAPSLQQHAAALVQKINQTKMQEELIAREIVINDAEPSIRYKLTKRQTQEEIQRSTGSVVITRGKYRPQNGPCDGEKPLYLHISAGAHLETTADRIKAVDRAADIVEEMLKQGSLNNGTKMTQPLSTCVFLGFEADPSLNIVARIRGPNDQYVNHIMNETGATVLLRGRGSGNPESEQGEGQQPLHLLLSSNSQNGLERAKLLAENLLDTICSECGASRVSSCKVYGAVPPPQHMLPSIPANNSTAGFVPVPAIPLTTAPVVTTNLSQGSTTQPVRFLSCGQSQPNVGGYAQPSVSACTSYNGYAGIYPQATPLQQVALALRQSSSPVTSTVSPVAGTAALLSTSLTSEKEKRQRRKFQELPVNSEWPAESHQDPVFSRSCITSNIDGRNISNMPSPKKLTQQAINGFPPPPPRSMPPPAPPKSMAPPPPKFSTPPVLKKTEENHRRDNTESKAVPDTLIQLMQYGDEDDDDDDDDLEETSGETVKTKSNVQVAPKPFWAARS